MKRTILFLLILCGFTVSFAQDAENEYAVMVDGIYYERYWGSDDQIHARIFEHNYNGVFPSGDIRVKSQVTIGGNLLDVNWVRLSELTSNAEPGAKIIIPSSVETLIWCAPHSDGSKPIVEFDSENLLYLEHDGLAGTKLPEQLYLANIIKLGATSLSGTTVNKLTLGSNLSSICWNAFSESDITELEFEEGNHESLYNEMYPYISCEAFSNMKIKELKLPKWENMSIGDCVATNCSELERVVFPDVPYITYAYDEVYAPFTTIWYGIYGYFFKDCPKLKEVVCLGTEPLEIKDLEDFATRKVNRYNDCETFEFMDNIDQCVLKVPAGSEEKYRNHPIWGKFKTIYGFENGDYTSISGIAAMDGDADGESEYFNLQGVKVTHPTPGNIYIHRGGAKVEKVAM